MLTTTQATAQAHALQPHTFTMDEFYAAICSLRKKMGDKDFWAKARPIRDEATKALGFVYINTTGTNGEPLNEVETANIKLAFQSTMMEYNAREMFIICGF